MQVKADKTSLMCDTRSMNTLSPDSKSIASYGEDGTIQIWNPITGKKSEEFVYEGLQDGPIIRLPGRPMALALPLLAPILPFMSARFVSDGQRALLCPR